MTTACARGKRINLAQGICDTTVPGPVIRGAKQAMDFGINTYTRFDGLVELRAALAYKLAICNSMAVNPETEITVSAGGTGAFQCACMVLLNPGDEVIIFEPYDGYHLSTIQAVEAIPRVVSLRGPDWSFSLDDLEHTITARTKAIVVNTLGNPSGTVFTSQEIGGDC